MSELRATSEGIVQDLEDSGVVGIDPITIITIITTLVQIYAACKKSPRRALANIKNPGFLHRVVLKRVVAENVDDNRDHVEAAVRDAGKSLTEARVKAIFAEVT